jgi:hypothetical protein
MFCAERQKGKKEKDNMRDNKIQRWGMRATSKDRKQINNLAKRLGVKESEAVRRAVAYLLAEKSKTAQVMR